MSVDVQVFTFLIPYIISIGISFGVGVFSWRRRSMSGASSFAVVAFSLAFWTLGFVLELFGDNLAIKNAWDSFQYLCMAVWLWALFSFAVQYTNRPLLFPRATWIFIIVFPVIALAFIFTNDFHNLFKVNLQLIAVTPFIKLTYGQTWLSWSFFGCFCLFYLWAFLKLLARFLSVHRLYRAQIATITVGAALPMIGLILTAVGVSTIFNRDTEPYFFTASSLVIAWGLFRYELFNLVPIAREVVIDNLDDAVGVIDTQNRVIDVNSVAELILGQPASSIIGKPVQEVLSEWSDLIAEYLAAPRAQFDVAVDINNEKRTLEMSIIPVYDRQNRYVGRVIFAHDITSRKAIAEELRQANEDLESRVADRTRELENANQELKREVELHKKTTLELGESEQKYRDLVENIDQVFYTVDLEGRITYISPVIEKVAGYSPSEMMGKVSIGFVLKEDRPHIAKKFDGTKTGMAEAREYRFLTKSGEIRWMRADARPIRKGSKIVGVQGILSDITEHRRAREMMVQTEKMMSVGGLAAGMAHELNNPLGAMVQATQNVLRRLSPDLEKNYDLARETGVDLKKLQTYLEKRNIKRTLESIRESGHRAGAIIANMLQFSRRSESYLAPTDLAKLIRNSLELAYNDYDLKKSFDFKNIEITEEIAVDMPRVPCTETEIEQVILNLLKNSAQAMAAEQALSPPKIRLSAWIDSDMAVIEVEDNGPGMPESVRNRVFEPFYTTKPVGEGTGLGLSVSFMIITQNHKGQIQVESEEGKGTRFTIHLPLNQVQEAPITSDS